MNARNISMVILYRPDHNLSGQFLPWQVNYWSLSGLRYCMVIAVSHGVMRKSALLVDCSRSYVYFVHWWLTDRVPYSLVSAGVFIVRESFCK